MNIIALAAAVLPALFLVRYFAKRDRFPEPTHLLVKTFLLGLAITVPIVLLELVIAAGIYPLRDSLLSPILTAFVVAGLTEECFKLLVLHRYCARRPEFDEPMDAVVYGVVASLGFACLENVMYVAQGGLAIAAVRALTAIPVHASLGALMGYYYGVQRFGPRGKARFWSKALWVPVLLHGLYDVYPMVIAFKAERDELSPLLLLVTVVPFFVLLVLMIRRTLALTGQLQREQFRKEARQRHPDRP